MSDERAGSPDDRHAEPPGGDRLEARPALATAFGVEIGDILASISDGFVALDNNWRFTYINAGAERMAGIKAETLIGKTIFDSLNVDPNNPFHVGYLASKTSGEPVAFAAYSEMFGRWIEVRGYPYPDGYTILFRDVSEERAAHRALIDSKRPLEAERAINSRIFETSIDLILVVDGQGNYIRVSPSAETILGFRPHEMVGRNGVDFVYHEDLDSTREEMRLARRGHHMRNFECRYVHKDGRMVPLAWTGVWSAPEQQHFFIGRDMTEPIRLEAQLRQAQKMEAVGQLTGGVAHDFNNILTVITTTIDILARAVKDDPKLETIARSIEHAADRGAQLTQRMLAFARRQPLQARSIDLNEVVTHAGAMLRRTLGEDVDLKLVLGNGLWWALADPSQVEDAVLNLALNARDAMPKGGRLVIETANAQLDEQYTALNVEATPGDYVVVSVTDSGTGMSSEVLERAFEPFFTTKDVGRGTGLGLSMVYGFVKQSRGHIKIYSELGHGTCIKIYLPRAEAAAAAEVAATRTAGAVARGRETILVVEDDPAVRTAAVNILESLGYEVLRAEDGKSALAIVQTDSAIDLLFTDMIMPNGMSGQDLLGKARALRPGLKALFTSGYSEHFIAARGDADLDVPLLGKPYRKQALAEAIRNALDGTA